MGTTTFRAYAKLNLTMEVLSCREDGYHNIRSIMQFISLYDVISIAQADSFSFTCNDEQISNPQNLCVKAYNALAERVSLPPVHIRLDKRVPYMSGMGSGSADCATVLTGLNSVFSLGISTAELMQIGKTLGADVPPCIQGGCLVAEGIGDIITPVPHSTKLFFNVIMPQAQFSTPQMYKKIDDNSLFSTYTQHDEMLHALQSGDIGAVSTLFYNDFQPLTSDNPCIADAVSALVSSGALSASMTGAGSAVFGIYSSEEMAISANDKLNSSGYNTFFCTSI